MIMKTQTSNHFDTFRIRGFKGFAETEMRQLGTFNLLLGANEVGKTSLLEAIFLLSGVSNLELLIRIQNQRDFLVSSLEDLSYLFHGLDTKNPIEISAKMNMSGESRSLSVSVQDNGVLSRSIPVSRNGPSKLSSSSISTPPLLHYSARIFYPGKKKNPLSYEGGIEFPPGGDIGIKGILAQEFIIPARIIRPSIAYETESIANVIVNKKEDELLEILKYVNPRIEKVATSRNTAYFDTGLEKMIPLNMLGSGTVRTAQILSHCLSGKEKVLLIDEIENGLHYKAMEPVLKSLLKLSVLRDVQIFATSHSIEVLRCLQRILSLDEYEEMRSKVACHVLVQNRKDGVDSYYYDYPQFDHCIKNDLEIR